MTAPILMAASLVPQVRVRLLDAGLAREEGSGGPRRLANGQERQGRPARPRTEGRQLAVAEEVRRSGQFPETAGRPQRSPRPQLAAREFRAQPKRCRFSLVPSAPPDILTSPTAPPRGARLPEVLRGWGSDRRRRASCRLRLPCPCVAG